MPFDARLFQPLERKDRDASGVIYLQLPPAEHRRSAWRRFKKKPAAMAGLIIIGVLIFAALFGPLLSPHSFSHQNLENISQGPSREHWFGTDYLGRDLFARTMSGARVSLSIGLAAALSAVTIGVIYGGIAGLAGGGLDFVMMRLVDIIYSIPFLLWVILFMVFLRESLHFIGRAAPGLAGLYIALGLVFWLPMARQVRGQILSLKEQEFILAARVIGVSKGRLLWRHLIPNCLGPVLITALLIIPEAIFAEAWLSFVGLGVSAPGASWGALASDALIYLKTAPHLLFFPAAMICITLLAFNYLSEGLHDVFKPRSGRG